MANLSPTTAGVSKLKRHIYLCCDQLDSGPTILPNKIEESKVNHLFENGKLFASWFTGIPSSWHWFGWHLWLSINLPGERNVNVTSFQFWHPVLLTGAMLCWRWKCVFLDYRYLFATPGEESVTQFQFWHWVLPTGAMLCWRWWGW